MAFENLEPFRDEILALRRPGPHQKKLSEIADHLFDKHQLRTTPGTLSRYLKYLRQPDGVALRELDDDERERLDAVALLTEVLVEVRGRSDEQRLAIEHLAGQVGIATRAIEELERKVAGSATGAGVPSTDLIRKIWLRAFGLSVVAVGLIAALIVWLLRSH